MRLRALVLALLLPPVQAAALSCLPWHVENAFQEAADSASTYRVVQGRLEFDTEDLPQVDWSRQEDVPPETRLPARLSGTALGRRGETAPFDEQVTLIVECAGPWCPQLRAGADYLAFVKLDEAGDEIRIGACGGMAFQDPGADMVDRIRGCLDGADCEPPVR